MMRSVGSLLLFAAVSLSAATADSVSVTTAVVTPEAVAEEDIVTHTTTTEVAVESEVAVETENKDAVAQVTTATVVAPSLTDESEGTKATKVAVVEEDFDEEGENLKDPNSCLNVGSVSHEAEGYGMLFIQDGIVNKNWKKHLYTSDTVFDVFLSEDCVNDTLFVTAEEPILNRSGFVQLKYNHTVTSSTARKPSAKFTEQPMEILMTYQCPSEVEITQEYHFNQTLRLDGFEDITYDWVKVCLPPKPIIPSTGGWNGAEIFFFVCFLLTLIGCVGTCAYNYTVKGMAGPEAIPCYTSVQNCIRGMGSQPANRTPQMNYDDTSLASDADFGAAYQTDL